LEQTILENPVEHLRVSLLILVRTESLR